MRWRATARSQGDGRYNMTEGSISVEHLEELLAVNARLQHLVCELLLKNQELRTQLSAEEENPHGLDPL